MSRFRILSLDGGGIRGVLTARLLGRLEAARPGFLSGVDLFAGTSTGGILALGLAAGLTPEQCADLYVAKGEFVFADSLTDDLRDLGNSVGAQYSNVNLKRALTDQFGARTLADLPTRVLISSFDLDCGPGAADGPRTWKPKFFHNFPGPGTDAAEPAVDVALRTSAAPTFFPTYQGYIDGGVVANNPSMCALAQALDGKTGGQDVKDVLLLSVGTGRNPMYLTQHAADWGWVQWAGRLIEIVFGEGTSGVADYQCRRILGDRYHRLNPILGVPITLDAVDQIPMLLALAEKEELKATLDWLDGCWAGDGRAAKRASPKPKAARKPARRDSKPRRKRAG